MAGKTPQSITSTGHRIMHLNRLYLAPRYLILVSALALACRDSTTPVEPPIAPVAPPIAPLQPPTPGADFDGEIAYYSTISGITLIKSGKPAEPLASGTSPSWSPDGSKLVFSNTQCDTDWETYYRCDSGGLVIMNPETREVTSPPNGALGLEPAWSPDGRMIAFTRHDVKQLFVMRLDGSVPVGFSFPNVDDVFDPSWSPDGRRIAFTCLGVGICIVNSDGTGFVRLDVPFYAVAPAWSPDGSRIAFEIMTPGNAEIALMAVDGTAVTRVTSGYEPAWSPDGTRLVFSRNNDGLFAINTDGSHLTRLTHGNDGSAAWRP